MTTDFTGLNPLSTIDKFLVWPEAAKISATDRAFIGLVRAGKTGTKNQFLTVLGESEILDQLDPEDDSVEVIDEAHGIALITGKRRLKTVVKFYEETYGAALENVKALPQEQLDFAMELRVTQRHSLRELARVMAKTFDLKWVAPDDSQIAGLAICRSAAEQQGFLFDRHKAWNGFEKPVSVIRAAVIPGQEKS